MASEENKLNLSIRCREFPMGHHNSDVIVALRKTVNKGEKDKMIVEYYINLYTELKARKKHGVGKLGGFVLNKRILKIK